MADLASDILHDEGQESMSKDNPLATALATCQTSSLQPHFVTPRI